MPEHLVGVAVPVPGLGLLTYRVPAAALPPRKGARVHVPLGNRLVTGCVVVEDMPPPPDAAALKDLATVIDGEPFLPPDVVDLALWVAEYYACGPGDVLPMAMPPSARNGQTAFRTTPRAQLTEAGRSARPKSERQRAVMDALAGASEPVPLAALVARGIPASAVRRAAAAGLVAITEHVEERDPFADRGGTAWVTAVGAAAPRELTDEQAAALATLAAASDARAFRAVLLHGVTGSGKTEVYVRLARHVMDAGRRVLVLVPEIALTPVLAGLLAAAFGSRVAIQHSGLSEGERHDQWQRIRRGGVDLVVGTRSAVFAPLGRLGLIIVDEEHEASYKQDETPRYHGRDVAVKRAQMDGALVVLGSATPSLESAANAAAGRYARVSMRRRILDRPLADVRVVNMRGELAASGAEHALSRPLVEAMEQRLAAGEQCLVLLNRRGFATVIFCRECGAMLECPHCSVTLTFHKAARRVRCHYCDYASSVPRACGECGGAFLEQSGIGTERLEGEVRERFPTARVARVDRDTMRRRGAVARVIAAVAAGEIDVLVGTQMIAKGHDFPAVTLVGVVSADVGLGLADFRSAERTFQLLTQVVGRAGRGAKRGEAIIQTVNPDHYSVHAAAAQNYDLFLARELEFRTAMRYPPTLAMVNVVVRHTALPRAMADAEDLAARVRQQHVPAQIVGPAPAALARIKDEYRAQFFLKGRDRRAMRRGIMAALEARPDLKRRTIVDVDPVSVV